MGILTAGLAHVSHVAYACDFGSFAQGTSVSTSDVDVLLLQESRNARQKV